MCFSEIDSRARKCPFCHALQGTLQKLLVVGILLVPAVLVGSMIWFDYWIYHYDAGYRGPDYADDIEITSSRFYFVPGQTGKHVSIVGELQNVGTAAVDRVTIEARLFNADGQLIDSYTDPVYDYLAPGDEVSFKLSGYQNIHLPEEEYARHTLIVRSATAR